jgi:hypothetical protein
VKRLVSIVALASMLASGCTSLQDLIPRDLLRPDDKGPVRRIAVLPFAHRGAESSFLCDLCPDRVVMDVTSENDASLATAFLYEALTRYPRIQVLPYERVRQFQAPTMRETITKLAEQEKLDGVLVGALLELRPRLGDPRTPKQRGGAALYVALLDLPSGLPAWKRVYDRSSAPSGRAARSYHWLVGEDERALTADETMEEGITRMVPSLIKALR